MLERMRMGTKVLAGFGAAVAVALLVGAAGYRTASRISEEVEEVAGVHFPAAQALARMTETQTAAGRALYILFIPQMTNADRDGALNGMQERWTRMDADWAILEKLPKSEAMQARWSALAAPWGAWRTGVEETERLLRQREQVLDANGPASEAQAYYDQAWTALIRARAAVPPAVAAMKALTEQSALEVAAAEAAAHDAVETGSTTIIAALAVGAALLLALGLFLARSVGGIIRSLLAEAGKLTRAVQQGRLAERGDAPSVNFEFRGVVEGMNATMDAFARPIGVTADYVTRISRGEIPAPITDAYEGDFNRIKDALNACIDAVNRLAQDANGLVAAAVEGRLSSRADASRHQGDFRKIVDGVNRTLDTVLAPVQEAAGVLEKLAERDLTARVAGQYQGDHARIKDALNATAEALHDALAQVAQAVEQVSSASAQIAASSQSVADGASEQASSLEETSGQLESMAAMTKQAADHAQQANGLAAQAKGAAGDGAAAMEQMGGAMTRIRASAEGTSQIIKDINEIAFQTNLLALNAAVEAARAGEAGRGFAVVAEEVRALALRSKEAATKTEELIRQSVKEAGEGETTSRHVSAKLAEIVGAIGKVSDIVAEMNATAKEQSAGIAQVNTAVGQMDKVTQQNAASSEESSSAAAELSGQSEELAAMVGSFRIARATQPSRPAVRPAPSAAATNAPAQAPLAPRAAAPRKAPAAAPVRAKRAPVKPADVFPLEDGPDFRDF